MAQLPGSARYVQYTASEGQTTFIYSFKIYEDDEITVQQDDTTLTITTDYTVTGAGEDSGGTIVLVTGATAGDILTLTGNTMIERGTEFTDGGDFEADSINEEYDRLDYITSELLTQQGQTVRFDPIQESLDPTLSTLTANRCIVVNSAGDGLEMSTYDPDSAQTDAAASAAASAASASASASSASDSASSAVAAALSETNAATSASEAAASAASINPSAFGSDLIPDTDDTRDLGSTSKAWAEAHINDMHIGGDVAVNTDKVTIDGATGDTAIAGDLDVTGTITQDGSAITPLAALYTYSVAQGTDGGTYTTAYTWQIRPINTEVFDDIGISLASNFLTVPAGTYTVTVTGSCYGTSNTRFRIYDNTNTAVLAIGPQTNAGELLVTVYGVFTLTDEATISIEMMGASNGGATGDEMGSAVNNASWGVETYINVMITKIP